MNYESLSHNSASNICRTCLKESEDLKSIFSIDNEMSISQILMLCANITIYEKDGLPEKICSSCSQKMFSAYSFRQLCENSEAHLKQCLNKLESVSVVEEVNNDVVYFHHTSHPSSSDESNQKLYKSDIHTSSNEAICDITKNSTRCDKYLKESRTDSNFTVNNLSKQEITRKMRNLPKTCDVCNKTFRFHSTLARHKLTHTEENPYLCSICGKGFKQAHNLKIHSFSHTGERPYECRWCEKRFAAPGTLMTHTRTHTGERPFTCKICGKDFPQAGSLTSHIRTHTGEKPMQCKICNKKFNQSGRLVVHMRIHSGEKPYLCPTCGKSFAIKGTLKKHIRTHTGERPYTCTICSQAFAQKGTLNTHMKVHKQQDLTAD
ncbi:gastrula zinc finger protein XlCGF8.2DB isoform X2 [Aethina tumida]|uniref:gastrula zinc finger protein XlCGF8.2DB isoform X2 n=1 Tax=Aethina tumida TaxID=116153 RepID=UPI002148A69D|nr:gastrula zinc finger protein XlCGF8.2DB isoform X2 [Aethina tumida]